MSDYVEPPKEPTDEWWAAHCIDDEEIDDFEEFEENLNEQLERHNRERAWRRLIKAGRLR